MPPVAAAAVTFAVSLGSAVIAGTALSVALVPALLAAGGTLVLGLATQALSPKPKTGGIDFDAGSRTVSLRQPAAPWRVIYGQTRVGGIFAFMGTRGENNKSLDSVIVLAGHEVEGIGDIYFDDTAVTIDPSTGFATGKYAGTGSDVLVIRHLGEPDQAADAWMLQLHPDEWTADHRLRGRAYIFVGLFFNPNIFPNGLPNITAIVKGRKVYDPRDETQDRADPTTWKWSDNPALCKADLLTNKSFGVGADWSEIDEDTLIEAANVCDELVEKADGTTEKRYTCNGSFTTDADPKAILESMNSADVGLIIPVGGKWRFYSGAYRAPTVSLDEDDLRGPITVQTLVSRRENFNAVKGTFVSPDNFYQPTDFPAVKSDVFMAEDGGERVYKDITLAWTNSASMAQRIAKIILLRARQQMTTVWPCKLGAYQCQVPDVVNLNNTRFGWSDKPFEVAESTLTIEQDDQGNPYLGVNLTLRETDPSVYDWSTSEEQAVDPAPNTNLPDPFTVGPPGAISVEEEIYVTRAGDGVKTKANLSWLPATVGMVREYQVEYRLSGEASWKIAARTPATILEVFDLAPALYEFRIKSISELGVSSNYTTASKQIAGLLTPPTEPQNLTISSIGGLAILRWDPSTDLDVKIGGHFEFRHTSTIGSATWQGSTSIGEALPGSSTIAILPLKAGTYLVRAVDSAGVYSASFASVEASQATALTFANVDSLTENPTFSGAKNGVVLDGGALKLGGGALFDTIANFDLVADLDLFGGVTTSGTYDFSGGIDLGVVKNVRVTSAITATIINTLDKIDNRTGGIDDWQDFDGNAAASADAQVWARTSPDSIAGTPTWSPWQRVDSAEFSARSFQFQCRLMTADPAYNINVTELSVSIDEVV